VKTPIAVAAMFPLAAMAQSASCPVTLGEGQAAGRAMAEAGRYKVVGDGGVSFDLAGYAGRPELSCYTPQAARKLNSTIAVSETVRGSVKPRWRTTVVCGFVEETRAVCWQYSPKDKRFIQVGSWIT
jgi:hypothetical protein